MSYAIRGSLAALLLTTLACADAARVPGPDDQLRAPVTELAGPASAGAEAYLLSAIAPDRCMGTRAGSVSRGAGMFTGSCVDAAYQRFAWQSSGELRIAQYCLGSRGTGLAGEDLETQTCDGSARQRWAATTASQIQNAAGACIAVQYGASALGTRLVLARCADVAAQRWNQRLVGAPAAVVTRLDVAPSTDTLTVGTTVQLQAAARDIAGNVVPSATILWSSSDTSVARVSPAGIVTGVAPGAVNVTAAVGSVTDAATLLVVAVVPDTPPADTTTPGGDTTGTGGSGAPLVSECSTPRTGWIFCDDFEQDRLSRYFEVTSGGGSTARLASVGVEGSTGMRTRFTSGQLEAGGLKLAFGRTPSTTFRPADAGTANYREIYWRAYYRNQSGWTSNGATEKLSRAMILAGSNWSQAMIAHVWSSDSPVRDRLQLDPVSGTDASGNVVTTGYNDFSHFRWLGRTIGTTPVTDAAHVGRWYCIESHVRLNDAGQSNGVFELWIDGQREATRTGLNWIGSYSAYGINAIFFENYWNGGAPGARERYLDNIVVSTQPIGCGAAPSGGTGGEQPPPPPPPPAPAAVASVSVSPSTASINTGASTMLQATLRDASGNVLTGRAVTWSSANGAVATVSGGQVYGVSAGTVVVTASSEGRSGQATITVVAPAPPPPPPPPGSTACANEPTTMSSIFLQPFDRLPTSNGTRLDGFYFDRNAERVTLESASAPEGGTYAAGLFPQGWTAGRSPFRYERDFNARYTTLYQCFWFRHSENFTDGGTGLNKVFFYRGSSTNHYYAFESGRNGEQDGFYPRITLQGGAGNRDIRTTFHAKPLGVWRKYEILMVGNTPGLSDGIARIWVNGQMILDARDVAYWSASQTPGWTGISWDPTYGGGGNNVPYDMYQYLDQWYVSGR